MAQNYQRNMNRLFLIMDAIGIVIAYVLAWYIRMRLNFVGIRLTFLSVRFYMRELLYIVPIYLMLYYFFKLYSLERGRGRRYEAWNIVKANVSGILVLTLILYLTREINFSRYLLLMFTVMNTFVSILLRNVLRQILRAYWKNGIKKTQLLLIGYSHTAEQYINRILGNPEWGYEVRGILDNTVPRGTDYRGIKVIGSIDNLMIILPQNHLDEIAITLGIEEYKNLKEIVNLCEKSGVHTKFVPDYTGIIPTKPYTEDLMGLPVINIRHVPLTDPLNAMIKRVVDIFGSLVAIILFSPVMLITAISIKASSPGPLIYKQERVGLGNKTFSMYKFRSMIVQDAKKEKGEWTTPNDPRVTSIGKFIRKTSIDELPQLFNILKGDMSMVGPRPERPFFVEKFKEEIPRYMIKHQVRPGLTGWAQINGFRGDTSIRKRIECDLYYIENWTLELDFKIIFLTFFKGFINKNAY